jgi:GTP cyclohydrolase IA
VNDDHIDSGVVNGPRPANRDTAGGLVITPALPINRTGQVATAIASALAAHGIERTDEDFAETPQRWSRMLEEFFAHSDADLRAVLKNGFTAPREAGMVIQQNIPFRALCPHHLLPVFGRAAIGYVPRARVVGLSKLSRIVDVAGTIRPDTQENITGKIADALFDHLDPQGVIVFIRACHTCMAIRGVAAPDVWTSTSVVKGIFRDVPAARQEFFSIVNSAS